MNGFIYLIESLKNRKRYLGSTDNPNRRILEHNNGKCESTRLFKPWKYILIINVGTIEEARIIEKYIKQHKEKLIVPNIIKILNRYFKTASGVDLLR